MSSQATPASSSSSPPSPSFFTGKVQNQHPFMTDYDDKSKNKIKNKSNNTSSSSNKSNDDEGDSNRTSSSSSSSHEPAHVKMKRPYDKGSDEGPSSSPSSSMAGSISGDGGSVSNQGSMTAAETAEATAGAKVPPPSSSSSSSPTNDKHSIAWLKARLESQKTTLSSPSAISSSSTTAGADALLVKELDQLSLQDVKNTTPKESEVIRASHLNRLSGEEREQILQDIHGVAPVPDETPEFVHDALMKMGDHINQLLNEYHHKQQQIQEQKNKKKKTYEHPQGATSGKSRSSNGHDDHDDGHLHPYEIAWKGNNFQTGPQRGVASSSSSSSTSTSYFTSEKFRIRFLRAERFEPKKSAERFLMYFEQKLDLFGQELLPKHVIGASDLNDVAFNLLLEGHFQLLPDRDRAGRAVILGNRKGWPSVERGQGVELLQALWVFLSAASDDEETQRKGFAYIYYAIDAKTPPDRRFMQKGSLLGRSFPLRIVAVHTCTSSAKFQAAMSVVTLLMGKNNSLRSRCHKGSHMECFYSLMQFGIRVDTIPIDSSGNVDTSAHAAYWEKKRRLELSGMPRDDNNAKTDMEEVDIGDTAEHDFDFDLLGLDADGSDEKGLNSFDCEWDQSQSILLNQQSSTVDSLPQHPAWKSSPGPGDILLGRGKSIQNHPGNIRYRSIIEKNLGRFESATERGAKRQLVKDVLQQVYSSGANFWKLDGSSQSRNKRWTPVDEKTACDKVSHSFRNAKMTPLNRRSSSGSSIGGSSESESAASQPPQQGCSTASDRSQKRPRCGGL